MIKPYFSVVIGKGFGDEGKGMAVDYLASHYKKALVVRHNGGAQSGHTVELPDKRFVFHELSSGSFRGADTFWADTYYPDMYKLKEEIDEFKAVNGGDWSPVVYADVNTQVTTIDDVLLNMAAETMRGEGRHGSCGMGIYEAFCRGEAGYGITIGELRGLDFSSLVARLERIRENYVPRRMKELGLDIRLSENPEFLEYMEMLEDRAVLENVASVMLDNVHYIQPVENVKELFYRYEGVIFESGQGLLLDTDNEEYSPHVTASKTGLSNPCRILGDMGCMPNEVVYVTRTYVTRHGAGALPNECDRSELGIVETDITNIHNPWQGSIRYARHSKIEEFAKDIKVDMENLNGDASVKCMLMITHLDESKGMILCEDEDVRVEEFCEKGEKKNGGIFDGYYLSWSRYGDVKKF